MNTTPGPWTLTDDGYVVAGEKYIHEPNALGREIIEGGIIPDEVMANARLIAQAPRLLAALKDIAMRTSAGTRTMDELMRDMQLACDRARAAIAQAAGKD